MICSAWLVCGGGDEEGLMEDFARQSNRGIARWVLGEVLWAAPFWAVPLWLGWKEIMMQQYERAWRYSDIYVWRRNWIRRCVMY